MTKMGGKETKHSDVTWSLAAKDESKLEETCDMFFVKSDSA